jgi:hypothetical protein
MQSKKKTANMRIGENVYLLVNSLRAVSNFQQRHKAQAYAVARIASETGTSDFFVLCLYREFLAKMGMSTFYSHFNYKSQPSSSTDLGLHSQNTLLAAS